MSSRLFSPITIGSKTFPNRIVVAPMCQYSANDGCTSNWHLMHLGTLAGSGAGLVMLEATAVERAGRITHGCLGLYNDANEQALKQTMAACQTMGNSQFGIQLAHAGRKASSHVPWEGGLTLQANEDPWRTFSASVDELNSLDSVACTEEDMVRIKQAFVDATQRAIRLGFPLIEIHAAHGYLLHQFLSPIANRRTDNYGGSLENRMRFPLEVFKAMKQITPEDVVLGVRITGTDWLEGGITIDESIAFAVALENLGCDYVDVTSGGVAPAKIAVGPDYQVPFASAIKAKTKMVVRAVGMIVTPKQAEEVLVSGAADAVALARAFLDNPHWPYEAARVLGATIDYPPQYVRSAPKLWPGSALKS